MTTSKFPPSIDTNSIVEQSIRLNVVTIDESLSANLSDEDPSVQLKAAITFSNQPYGLMPLVPGLQKSQVVPILVRHLNDPLVQKEVISSITKIASISCGYSKVVVETTDCVSILISFLSSDDEELRALAVNALGTITSGNPASRDEVLEAGVMGPLLKAISGMTVQEASVLRTAAWTLASLCGGIPLPSFYLVSECLDTLVRLINAVDEEVIASACWAFSSLTFEQKPVESPQYTFTASEETVERLQMVLDRQITHRVVDLLTHRSMAVQLPAVKIVCNISLGNEQQIKLLLDNKVVTKLKPLLNVPRALVRAEACKAYGNIARRPEYIEAVLSGGIMPRMITIATHDSVQVVKEAVLLFCNLLKGTQTQVKKVVEHGVVGPLSEHVLASNSDSALVFRAIEATEHILMVGAEMDEEENPYCHLIEQAGGIERFDLLQFHNNALIYQKAREILRKYFPKATK